MKKIEEMKKEEVLEEIRKFEDEKFDKNENFVFVSYSHMDMDIVLKMVLEWIRDGYNIAIDLDFENHTSDTSWIDLMEKRLRSDLCVQIVCFRSPNYYYSYASLIEILLMRSDYLVNKRTINKNIPIDIYTIKNPIMINENDEAIKKVYKDKHKEIENNLGNGNKFFDKIGKEKNELRNGLETLCKQLDVKDRSIGSPDEVISLIETKFSDGYKNYYNYIYSLFEEWFSVNDMNGNFKELKYNPRPTFDKQKVYKIITNESAGGSINESLKDNSVEQNNSEITQKNDNVEITNKNNEGIINGIITEDYFRTHKNDKDLIDNEQKALKFYDEFKSKFSPEKLKELSGLTLLRSIFLNDEGNQTNICSLFEYNKDYIQFGSIKGGTALKHILYYSAKENSWMTGKPPITFNKLTEQEAIALGTKIRDNIVKACEIIDKYKDKLNTAEAYEQMYNAIDNQADGIHKVLFVKKYFHMIYKDLFPCMFSTGYIRKIADLFGYEKNLDETKYIAKLEMTKNKHGISNYLFSLIVYKFLDETTGTSSSESKISNY